MPGVLADTKSSNEMSENGLKPPCEPLEGTRETETSDEDKGERVSSPDVESGQCVCVLLIEVQIPCIGYQLSL